MNWGQSRAPALEEGEEGVEEEEEEEPSNPQGAALDLHAHPPGRTQYHYRLKLQCSSQPLKEVS